MQPTHSGFFLQRRWLVRDPTDAGSPVLNGSEAERVLWHKTFGQGLQMFALGGGMVVFDFSAIPEAMVEFRPGDFQRSVDGVLTRLQIMNAWAVCLETAEIPRMDTVARLSYADHRNVSHGFTPEEAWRAARLPTADGGYLLSEDRPFVVPVEVLDLAAATFEAVLAVEDTGALEVLALVASAAEAIQSHNYPLGVVAAWTACETMSLRLLRHYMTTVAGDGPGFLTPERRERILDGRGLPAYVVTDILALAERLDEDTYKALTAARKARNAWVHHGQRVSHEAATQVLETAMKLYGQSFGIEVDCIPALELLW